MYLRQSHQKRARWLGAEPPPDRRERLGPHQEALARSHPPQLRTQRRPQGHRTASPLGPKHPQTLLARRARRCRPLIARGRHLALRRRPCARTPVAASRTARAHRRAARPPQVRVLHRARAVCHGRQSRLRAGIEAVLSRAVAGRGRAHRGMRIAGAASSVPCDGLSRSAQGGAGAGAVLPHGGLAQPRCGGGVLRHHVPAF